jgi:O-antigen biosynthesis alpha-1,2-mannosyltransferase
VRIKIQQFLFFKSHSWAVVGQNLGRALIKLGHEVDFISTDGFEEKYCPADLRPFVKPLPELNKPWPYGEYDCCISYTAPHNWPLYLQHGKHKFGIWNYEYNGKGILQGFGKFYKATDKVLPSSYFTREVFLNMGIPDEHMVVVPHGINLEEFESKEKIPVKTKKKHKILLNIAQIHRRKAIPLALEGFGKAFTQADDVCLIAKVLLKNKTDHQFDVDFPSIYKTFEQKFPKHAEVELFTGFVPNIAEIYNACDISYSATHAECFHLPSLETFACGKINCVPRYGGQLDFCNDDNSLLIAGRIARADRLQQYWTFNPNAVHFVIDTNDAAKKLQQAVSEYDSLIAKFTPHMQATAAKFTWEAAAKQILELCK